MLPSSVKGRKLIETISSSMNIYERSVKEAVDGNNQLRAPVTLTRRKILFRYLFPLIGKSSYRIAVMDKFLKYNIKRVVKKIIK